MTDGPEDAVPDWMMEDLGKLVVKKAAAFDSFTAWLSEQVDGPQFTTAMDPDWVVSVLKTRMEMTLESAAERRARRRRTNRIRFTR